MSLTQSWTDQVTLAASASSVFPLDDQIVSYEGTDWSGGDVWVEMKAPGGSFKEVPGTKRNARDRQDAFYMKVPDTAVEYRFACINIAGVVLCYMGP